MFPQQFRTCGGMVLVIAGQVTKTWHLIGHVHELSLQVRQVEPIRPSVVRHDRPIWRPILHGVVSVHV